MGTLTLANGTEINVLHAARGLSYPILHIYTNSLTVSQAAELFDNKPENTNEMTYRYSLSNSTENENDNIREIKFTKYTIFSSISKTVYDGHENAIMIRMMRSEID